MYKFLIRPFLFLFDPEKVHYLTFALIKFTSRIPGVSFCRKKIYKSNQKQLGVSLLGLNFPNRIGLAAGFDKNAKLIDQFVDFGFGFIEIGTVTPKPQPGNEKTRLFRLKQDKAIINRMGFNNEGVDEIAKRLSKRKSKIIIGGNIGKNTLTSDENSKQDYLINFRTLHPYVDYFVVNVSCPNVGSLAKLQNKDFLKDLMNDLKKINTELKNDKPILLKISPDLNIIQLDEVIEVVQDSKIAGVVATNTSTSREGLTTPKSKIEAIGNGGLSGAPICKKSTEVIKYLAEKSNKSFAIIGVGGIMSENDALEKIEAGADLIQLYTGFIYEGPKLIKRINNAILAK